MEPSTNLMEFKVVLLGDSGVGKTSILNRYISDSFDPNAKSTVGVSFLRKTIVFPKSSIKAQLTIWDTAGQEKFRSLASIHYKDSDAAVMVYDITTRGTFEGLKDWINEVKTKAPEGILIVMAGNKFDMIEQEKVTPEEAQELASKEGALLCFTSAKNDTGVNEMFELIAERLCERKGVFKGSKGGSSHLFWEKKSGSKSKCC